MDTAVVSPPCSTQNDTRPTSANATTRATMGTGISGAGRGVARRIAAILASTVSVTTRWAPIVAAAGCALVAAFWGQDNWMLVGEVLVLAGMWPLRACLARRAGAEDAAPAGASR